MLEDNIFKISPEERRSAAEKNKYFAPTEDEYITTNFYVNTVLCFDKSNPNNAVNLNTYSISRFQGDQVGVTTAAIQSGVTGLIAAGGHVWASHGGQVDSGQVKMEGVSCTEDLDNHSMYLFASFINQSKWQFKVSYSFVTPSPRLKNRVAPLNILNRPTVALTSHFPNLSPG